MGPVGTSCPYESTSGLGCRLYGFEMHIRLATALLAPLLVAPTIAVSQSSAAQSSPALSAAAAVPVHDVTIAPAGGSSAVSTSPAYSQSVDRFGIRSDTSVDSLSVT